MRAASITFFVALSTCFASAQNLIVNGDFTLGDTGFTGGGNYAITTNPNLLDPGSVSFLDHTNNSSGPRNMLFARPSDIAQPETAPIWHQQVSVTAGQQYAWTVQVAKTHAANPYTVGVWMGFSTEGGTNRMFGTDIAAGEWREAWLPVMSPTTTTLNLYIGAVGDPNITHDLVLDDISFVAVPEPGTMALLAGGAALVLRRRRRRLN